MYVIFRTVHECVLRGRHNIFSFDKFAWDNVMCIILSLEYSDNISKSSSKPFCYNQIFLKMQCLIEPLGTLSNLKIHSQFKLEANTFNNGYLNYKYTEIERHSTVHRGLFKTPINVTHW